MQIFQPYPQLMESRNAATDQGPTPDAMVDALRKVFGRHATMRASHAKGIFAQGSFSAAPGAMARADSPLFQASNAPTIFRFSVGGGNPVAPDKAKTLRGLSAHVMLPQGNFDLLTINAPVFFAKTPQQFVDFLLARAPDPATGKPNPDTLATFNAANPETLRQAAYLNANPIPASYTGQKYFGVHTFNFEGKNGELWPARWRLIPVDVGEWLDDAVIAGHPDHFLAEALQRRLAVGPAAWDVELQLPHTSDDLDDPTVAWPEHRPSLLVGRLTVTELISPDAVHELVFDPSTLPPGIHLSADPVLRARSAAYAVSLAQRASGN